MPHATGRIPPPIAPRSLPGGPPAILADGEPDPYAWMRDRDLPATRDYLAAERAYYDRHLDAALRDELAAELTARVLAAEDSVSWRRDGGTYFELAWAADSRSFFYTVPDSLYRPHEVWLHRLGTPRDQDVLVFAERDERFDLTVRSTRSGAYVL